MLALWCRASCLLYNALYFFTLTIKGNLWCSLEQYVYQWAPLLFILCTYTMMHMREQYMPLA